MERRAFLTTLAAGAALPRLSRGATPESPPGWRVFEVTTRVTLAEGVAPAQLWIPLAHSLDGYQQILGVSVSSSDSTATIVHDDVFGAAMVHAGWSASNGPQEVKVAQKIAARDRNDEQDFVPVSRAEREFWAAPSDSLPTDGIVGETSRRIVAGLSEPRAKLRALYDWVVDNTFRDPATRGCGVGDIKAMLETGRMGGKCADINSLMVGLTRAAGIPARDVYGVRVAESRQLRCLGSSGVISKAQHCRAEAYLDDLGWFPVDPADVRKAVLEAKLPVDSDEARALRERLFGSWEGNWIGYNRATDIKLPNAPEPMNANFLMYPCAMTAKGQLDCLDPVTFRYEITSREATM